MNQTENQKTAATLTHRVDTESLFPSVIFTSLKKKVFLHFSFLLGDFQAFTQSLEVRRQHQRVHQLSFKSVSKI